MDESWLIINLKCLGIGRWDIHQRSISKWQMSHSTTGLKPKKTLRITSKWESSDFSAGSSSNSIILKFYRFLLSQKFSKSHLFFCKGKIKGRVNNVDLWSHWTQQLGWHFTSWQIHILENKWYMSVCPKTLWGTRKPHCKCWIFFFWFLKIFKEPPKIPPENSHEFGEKCGSLQVAFLVSTNGRCSTAVPGDHRA